MLYVIVVYNRKKNIVQGRMEQQMVFFKEYAISPVRMDVVYLLI